VRVATKIKLKCRQSVLETTFEAKIINCPKRNVDQKKDKNMVI